MILTGHKELVAQFVLDRVGGTQFHDYEAIGVCREGVLIGGVVIHDYVAETRCSMTCAGDGGNWLERDFLPFLFGYVFGQLQCKVVIITIESSNYKSIRLMKHIGFKSVYTVKNGGVDSDLIFFEMQKADCKYLERREALGAEHGQKDECAASA